jgi:antirestriction protein ArdC
MNKEALYNQVTRRIIEQIEAGAGTWEMPWKSVTTGQVNASTGAAYKGGNHLWFSMVADVNGWSSTWATYKQWQAMGAQVRKGEKGTPGVKWSPVEDRRTGDTRLVPFAFTVFNADQVDGFEAPAPAPLDTPERIEAAEAFFAAVGADVHYGGARAYYAPVQDFIMLPALAQFTEAAAFYATSAHEHAHWTGHESRLNRDLASRFGDERYAMEELVAELSAAFTCAHLGISQVLRPDHAAYIASWLKVFKSDPAAIFTAASKAQAATDHLVAAAEARAEQLVAA